jgi:hypothetical protein
MAENCIRIGNAQGFWGDDNGAAARLLASDPDLDYLTMDYLAEVSLSIMAIQRDKDPELGYARDFVDVVRSLIPQWKEGGKVKLVSNAGGLNPAACARACAEALTAEGLGLAIGVVQGDDVLAQLQANPAAETFRNTETGKPLSDEADRLVTANAYIGAAGVAEALALGADIVITGRVADPSLVVGCGQHAYGWRSSNYDAMAALTVAGHLIECGTQACGGFSNFWMELEDPVNIGYPIVEIYEDTSCVLTKARASGGLVNERTVKEQLLYEIGDPERYLSPDCIVSFLGLELEEEAPNRVRIRGALGKAPTESYKVSATYRAGWRAEGSLAIVGHNAVARARRAGEVILQRLERDGHRYAETLIEVIGAGDLTGQSVNSSAVTEVMLRVAVSDSERQNVAAFGKALAPMVTSGPAGTSGYTSGRPKPRAVFGYWPCLIARSEVRVDVNLLHPVLAE